MSVLYGLYRPDEGELLLDGQPVTIESPRQAIDLGIGMVHQHFMLVPVMTVAENIVLASEPRKGLLLDTKAAARRVRELSDRFGLSVDPDARVGDISVGQQQRVEILRALDRGAEVLILDEPTAVLTAQETGELFKILRTLTAEGKSIVFISHKLGEVLEISDRVSVLRRGKKVDTVPTEGATEESLARIMVGRDVLFHVAKERSEPGPPLLEVDGLEVMDDRGLPAVQGVSLDVRAGEIVGIAGVDANGQAELVEAIAGLRRPLAGTIRVDGDDVTAADVRGKLAAGIGHIAEDRHRRGLVLDFSLAENLCLRDYRRPPISKRGLISPKRMNEQAAPLLEEYDVRGGSCEALALSLSSRRRPRRSRSSSRSRRCSSPRRWQRGAARWCCPRPTASAKACSATPPCRRCACWSPATRRRRGSASRARSRRSSATWCGPCTTRLGKRIEWALRARTGLTTLGVHNLLVESPPFAADIAVVITGVNDVTGQVTTRRAVRARARARRLAARYGRRAPRRLRAVAADRSLSAFAQPLRHVMGGDARRHDAALARWATTRAGVSHPAFALELDAAGMASDGFHPGEPVYRACGEALAAHVAAAAAPPDAPAAAPPTQPLPADFAVGRGADLVDRQVGAVVLLFLRQAQARDARIAP